MFVKSLHKPKAKWLCTEQSSRLFVPLEAGEEHAGALARIPRSHLLTNRAPCLVPLSPQPPALTGLSLRLWARRLLGSRAQGQREGQRGGGGQGNVPLWASGLSCRALGGALCGPTLAQRTRALALCVGVQAEPAQGPWVAAIRDWIRGSQGLRDTQSLPSMGQL